MTTTADLPQGGYRFIPGVSQYSGGVAPLPGFRIERIAFRQPVPLRAAFVRMSELIRASGRPLTALCACELRSPAPFTEQGFAAFNKEYTAILATWGLMDGPANPVARSNVCPAVDPPAEPCVHAFSFTQPSAEPDASFVVAGSGEAPEGHANYRDHIVRLGDTTLAGLEEKARFVLGEMERRMAALGGSWSRTTAVQLYTVHDIHPFLAREIVARGAARNGLTWHFNRPPVVGLEYEMDCRSVGVERVIAV